MSAESIGAIIAAAAVVVALGTFVYETAQKRRADRAAIKQEAVAHVLTAVERMARAAPLEPLSSLWLRAELDLAMVLPRLLLALPKEENAVVMWVARQSQLMQSAPSARAAVKIATDVSFRLASWNRGDLNIVWFEREEAEAGVFDSGRRPSGKQKIRRLISATWEWARVWAGLAVLRWSVRFVLRLLP